MHCVTEAKLFTVKLCWDELDPLHHRTCVYLCIQETEDLILVNIDEGIIQSSWSETIDLPAIPLAAAECFVSR